MNKTKVTIVSIFPKYSALWNYAFFLNNELSKNKNFEITFLDLYKDYQNKIVRAFALLRGISVKQSDVLICVAPLLSNTLKKSKSKLKILIAHDFYPITVGEGVSLFEKAIISQIYNNLDLADIILPVSDFCRREIIEKYQIQKEMQVLPGGIDHSVFKKLKITKQELREKYDLPKDKKILLHVGRDDKRKNFGFVLRLLKILKEEFFLVKVGNLSGDDKKFIENSSLKTRLTILKNLDEKKLCEIYNASDIFLFPSTYEGLGLPPIEAMACGLPVIAANNTGLKEVCTKESLTELNEEIWLEKIHKILKDSKTKNDMIQKGCRIAKRFDWKKYAKEIEKIINFNQLK
ncbi:glycosyltransferase family 4 protein [Candidatus Woesearchaeota archaeon]|nr:glycosyltransferase family 4 protein [Candidatus Woesearchaeota archaeon]